MNKKNILITAAVICIAGLFLLNTVNKKADESHSDNVSFKQHQSSSAVEDNKRTEVKSSDDKSSNKMLKSHIEKQIPAENSVDNTVRTSLNGNASLSVLPLSAITEISVLPNNIQSIVYDIGKDNSIFMIQKSKDKLLIISDNPENIRHNIAFTEVNILNGHQIKTTLGYNDKINDSKNDIWEYNKETGQPLRHTKYNKDGDMDFVEVWNYDLDNPVKYEMKNSDGKVISMRKETLSNGTDLRVEHLLYDKDGNTKINVTTTYDGEDVKRFTYYNSDKIAESGSVFTDYSDGQKIKEVVYTSDLKVKNTYTSDYKDGMREKITVYDNKNQEIKKYISDDEN